MSRICKDCQWFEPANYSLPEFEKSVYRHARCNAPQNITKAGEDALVGVPDSERRWEFCTTHRVDAWLWAFLLRTCGKRGRWFKAKEAKCQSLK